MATAAPGRLASQDGAEKFHKDRSLCPCDDQGLTEGRLPRGSVSCRAVASIAGAKGLVRRLLRVAAKRRLKYFPGSSVHYPEQSGNFAIFVLFPCVGRRATAVLPGLAQDRDGLDLHPPHETCSAQVPPPGLAGGGSAGGDSA